MSAALAETPPKLLTAEEFGAMDFGDRRVELVEGEVVEFPKRSPRTSFVGTLIGGSLGEIIHDRRLGFLCGGYAGVITRRNPDSVREPCLSFYGSAKMPSIPDHDDYVDFPPD